MDNYKIIQMLYKLLNKSLKFDCVPVSAIVVFNNKIIGKGYNLKEKTNNPIDHAEIIAIIKATKKLKTWNLSNAELYVTMKPCQMCEKVINEARIKNVYYLCTNLKEENKKTTIFYKKMGNLEDEYTYLKILKNFFKNKRK